MEKPEEKFLDYLIHKESLENLICRLLTEDPTNTVLIEKIKENLKQLNAQYFETAVSLN